LISNGRFANPSRIMKKFISRVQNLSQKAAELQAAMQRAPAKVAELRETVASTAGQFMQMRADVQSTLQGLRAEGEDRLTESLREIDASVEVFGDAGYVIHEVEMELGVAQRLIVHLEKADDVPHAILRQLMGAHQARKTTHAILAALIKAEEMSDRVHLQNLGYHKLTVYVGLAPSVRVCWGASEPARVATSPAPAVVATPPPLPAAPAFAQTSYFERRATPTTTPSSPVIAPESAAVVSVHSTAAAAHHEPVESAAEAGDSRHDALARFKKMPDLNKYRR
jgi:hypothetical protein